jgi:hypothetical protein
LVGLLALAGCAQPPAVATQSAAVRAGDGRFDESTQTIVFTGDAAIGAVDLHLSVDGIGGTRGGNVRMRPSGGASFTAGPIAVDAGDRLSYWFTTLTNGVGNDGAVASATVSAGFQPTALHTEVVADATRGSVVRLVTSPAGGALDWADVHYSVDGGPLLNLRMAGAGDGSWSQPVALGASSTLDYWVTYSAGGMVLDSGRVRYHIGAVATRLQWLDSLFVADRSQGPPAGCVADGDWYRCDPYAFSVIAVSGGYHFDGDVLLVPFGITGTGPYGEALLKTVRMAFDYSGDLPRVGSGVALLPTSAAHPGLPPADDADGAAGKRVDPSWQLHAGYIVGGEGLGVALVDTHGVRSQVIDIPGHRSTYCRYGCALDVPVAQLAAGTNIDLDQVRYVAFVTEDGATVDQSVTVTDISFGLPIL